jgi:hypothetical protein
VTELSTLFTDPYNFGVGGTAVALPPEMVAVDGRLYLLDTAGADFRREGIDVLQQRNTTSNRDLLLVPQNVWRQQDESWYRGAGQRHLDRDDSIQYRFHRSFNVNPWNKYELSLLNETSKIHTLTGADPCFLHVHNHVLYAVTGTGVTSWTSAVASPVSLSLGAGSGKAISTTYDGDAIIVLTDAGKIYRVTDPTTSTEWVYTLPVTSPVLVATDATFIAYVKDYLILGVGSSLVNQTATAGVLIYKTPATGFTWKGAAEGNNAIYCVGGAGDRHLIHRVGIKDDGTGLSPAVVAATLPDGEDATSIGSYLGYVFVGSQLGVRMATPANQSGDLVLGSLIRTESPVYGFEGQDRFVWITGTYINPVSDGGAVDGAPAGLVSGLYRADLSTFTVNESTPAYATDIVSDTYGTVRSVTTWLDRRVFSIDGEGVYIETTTKAEIGWLEAGRISFGVEDDKTGLYVQGNWEPLNGAIAFDIACDCGISRRILYWALPGSIKSGNISLDGRQFARTEARYVLYRDALDATKGPVLSRFELRARPGKGRATRWFLPLLNHESLDISGVPDHRNVNVEFDRLLDYYESGRMFKLQIGPNVHQVVAVDYRWLPQKVTETGNGWQGIFLLVVEEVR